MAIFYFTGISFSVFRGSKPNPYSVMKTVLIVLAVSSSYDDPEGKFWIGKFVISFNY